MSAAVRSLHSRAGVGLTANVVQQSTLRLSSVAVNSAALILMLHGKKTLRRGNRRWIAEKGDIVAVAGGQTLDIENKLSADGLFEARWVVWDASLFAQTEPLVQRPHAQAQSPRRLADVALLKRVPESLTSAVERAVHAISEEAEIPEKIAIHRLTELLLWLSEHGVILAGGRETSTSARLRGMISGNPAMPWTVATAAGRVATSETTLRRRLGAEGTSFNAILTEARMSLALTLLQSTERSVAAIASDVGYESASRFAIRFKSRYGFAPSVVRGHERQ